MTYTIVGYTSDSEVTRANQIKEMVVSVLANEKFITPEQAQEFNENYAIILHKKGMLGKAIEKFFEWIRYSDGSENYTISFVKRVK